MNKGSRDTLQEAYFDRGIRNERYSRSIDEEENDENNRLIKNYDAYDDIIQPYWKAFDKSTCSPGQWKVRR